MVKYRILFECQGKMLTILSVHLYSCASLAVLGSAEKAIKAFWCVCVSVYGAASVQAGTAVFCSESDPVNSSANFSIYP